MSGIFVENVGPSICFINLIAIWKDHNSEVGMIKTKHVIKSLRYFDLITIITIEQDSVQSISSIFVNR